MPNSHRIRTQLGVDKVLQINLDQDYEQLELLSFSFFPNDVYTRSCADFGVVCGRVFCNKGLGLTNARVSIFIPIINEDESNPIISTLYPYKSFVDFNEDGYKYNLLPYSPSHSGHVPVGTFPDRLDALTNQSVVEVYDKYYKFTAKTNDAGDFMIFGIPVGQYNLFMQVDLSDIGEFSLTPQDLIRMGMATEAQVAGTKFKFSENYSELPQIITLTKIVQISPFYGQDGICQHYITRADFDLTTEASIELQPTSIFMGSMISAQDRKKLKRNCRVPTKQGWLCNLITGPGQIETIRHTINTDIDGRPILEQYRLQNDGKLIDDNGTWVVELPMNLDYVYTDEFGNRRISPDGSVGVPIRGRYRFKIKWQQSPSLSEENKRAYFLIPNIKEYGWSSGADNTNDPGLSDSLTTFNLSVPFFPPSTPDEQPSSGPFDVEITSILDNGYYYNIQNTNNLQSFVILVDGIERPDLNDTIPMGELSSSVVAIRYTLIDPILIGTLTLEILDAGQFGVQSSYAFSRSWADYGTYDMIQEAINCEDRFYEFQYNKVYTVSQLIDRYSNRIFPQKSIQIKHILDDKCEGEFNPFPANDVYYRYDILYIAVNIILSIMKFQFFQILIFLHVLAFLWPIIAVVLIIIWGIQQLVFRICRGLQNLGWRDKECKEPRSLKDLLKNPFKNLNLPLFLYTEDGCERCRCKIDPQELDEDGNEVLFDLIENLDQLEETNISYLANFATLTAYQPYNNDLTTFENGDVVHDPDYLTKPGFGDTYNEAISCMLAGNAAANISYRRLPLWAGNIGEDINARVFSTSLTIAERLNLFNTKAKYFDNLTVNTEGASDRVKRERSISPGNAGWNQIRVTWNTHDNNRLTKFHYDNVLVILSDTVDTFSRTDILTFQDPSMSRDPHVLTTTGVCLNPSYVEVYYANPNTNPNDTPLLSTIYDIDLSRYPQVITPSPNGERIGVRVQKQVCFPMDIEYFQVIQVIPYRDYYFNTNTAPPENESNRRFSLPWRILRNQRTAEINNGNALKFASQYDDGYEDLNNVNFGNGQWVYRQLVKEAGTFDCYGACFYNTTHVTNNLNSIRSYFPYTETDPNFLEIERPDPNLNVIFLQRGVDINAPTLRNRYDLRRLFGVTGDWNVPPRIDHIDPNVGAAYDISDVCIVESNGFLPNVPIQTGGDSLFGFNINNSSGWLLRGRIIAYATPERPLFSFDSTFLALIESTYESDLSLINLPLVESTQELIDENNVFDGGIFTAPYTSEYQFTVFVRYQGSVSDSEGLFIRILNVTTGQPVWTSGGLVVSTDILYYSEEIILNLLEGNEYRLQFINQTSNTITFLFDSPSWILDNPHGLKLPKHNEFIENSPIPLNTTNGNIFFSSHFFRIPENSFTAFTSTMSTFYSALDENTIFWGSDSAGASWRSIFQTNLTNGGINYDGQFGTTVIQNNDGSEGGTDNMFSRCIVPSNFSSDGGGLKIPCQYSNIIDQPWQYCGNVPDLGVRIIDGGCNCTTDNDDNNCPGCCRYRLRLKRGLFVYHATLNASLLNEVGSYWGKEYVEGGSSFSLRLFTSSDNYESVYSTDVDCSYGGGNDPFWIGDGGSCDAQGDDCQNRTRAIFFNDTSQQYISPCYASFPNIDPPQTWVDEFFGSLEEARRVWYVNPNHEISINYRAMNVFRTDRLPSSTTPQEDGNGNGYLLHQNNGFSIYKIDLAGCSFERQGGGDLPVPPQISDVSYDNLPSGFSTVANSLSNCELAVDLNSYYVDSDGNPAIHESNPYSTEPAGLGADWLWFNRGRGCYNIVSKPLVSLFPHRIDGDPQNKFYWDVATVVEWIQRLKLTFAQCFEIFSHSFSNNWINGTLYAFPFQNATRFNSQNQPFRLFCKDVVYFHDPLNTYYYRSSPWNGTNFVGKYRDEGERGNLRNLQTPTTILDLGPKTAFIQEIVLSDDYDGYIVPRVPSTSFQDVTDILNLFILNRLVNTNFIQQLIPLPNDESGNEEGSDDPSVGAMFANTRWKNGDAFFANLLPGLIDGDYSQLISINSEFGVGEYSPQTYTNEDVYFGEDEGRGSILGFLGRRYSTKRPVLGIFFSGNNQLRDYISPRRTIWNQNALIPVQDSDFTDITTKTQVVPFYQWNMFHDRSDPDEGPSIFGTQSNNFITDYNSNYYTNSVTFPDGFFSHRYQSLDRFGDSSEYFNPSGNNTFVYKGFILNYSEQLGPDGSIIGYTPTFRAQTNPRYRYTFGAPFHFYFGLKQGSSAMDRFISIYVDTTVIYE